MANKYTNTACSLYGTKYCRALNMESCDKCLVSSENAKEIAGDVEAVLSMLPEEGLYHFFGTDECMLCRGEKKNKAVCYAMTDIVNPEPKREKRSWLGTKTRSSVGSMVPLQFSCCKECRSRHRAIGNRHIVLPMFAAIFMFALLNFNYIGEKLANVSMMLPLLLFAVVVGGAFVAGRLSRKNLIKNSEKHTYLNVFDVPGMDELAAQNWFEMTPGKDASKLVFSKEPLKMGLMTGSMAKEENI